MKTDNENSGWPRALHILVGLLLLSHLGGCVTRFYVNQFNERYSEARMLYADIETMAKEKGVTLGAAAGKQIENRTTVENLIVQADAQLQRADIAKQSMEPYSVNEPDYPMEKLSDSMKVVVVVIAELKKIRDKVSELTGGSAPPVLRVRNTPSELTEEPTPLQEDQGESCALAI